MQRHPISAKERDVYDLSHHALPVDAQPPCGPDCEYDASFLALSQAVEGKPEQQFGDTVIPAVEPDWRLVEKMATDLLGKTKDLRVTAWLTLAATRLHGIAGFAAGVQLMHLLCEQYWEDVHPRLIIEGENDPYLRIGALSSLSGGGGGYADSSPVLRALRDAPIANRAVTIRVRDVEMAAGNETGARYSDAQVVTILKDGIAEGSDAIAAFEQAVASFAALNAQVEARMSGGEQPDFSQLQALLKSVNGVIARARSAGLPELSDGNEGVSAHELATGAVASGSGRGAASGDIRSREDVRRALQRVCEYLEQHEPSSPASLFARRAERMLGMDFIGIVRELSPDSMQQIQMVTGVKLPEE
jgi:type VI secretion system protein ImpA